MARPDASTAHVTEPFVLGDDEVHVWYASQDCEAPGINNFLEYLGEDELRRAEGFRFRKDCDCFVIARGLLRILLSRYLGLRPEQLLFNYNSYGKPSLDARLSSRDIRFNLSHKGGLILYAFSIGRELGVDIEELRGELDFLGIARSFFSSAETMTLGSLPSHMHSRAFFNCWTRKEAYIKARGQGLSQPLNRFEVSLTPGEPARLLNTLDDALEAARWRLVELPLGEKYIGAIAVEGNEWQARHYVWKRGHPSPLRAGNIATTYFDDC